ADGKAPAADRALRAELGDVERERLMEALEVTGWNLSRAAARLRIPRNTLRYRMEKHGLSATQQSRSIQPPRRAPAAPEPARDAERHWEPRRLTWLRAVIAPGGDPELTRPSARAVDTLVEKLEMFGGRVEEADPKSLLAVFGLEPTE